MCPACLRGSFTAGPDEVRIPGPYQIKIGFDDCTLNS